MPGRGAVRTQKRAEGSRWDHLGENILLGGSTGSKRTYTRNRREAKKLIRDTVSYKEAVRGHDAFSYVVELPDILMSLVGTRAPDKEAASH